MAVADLQSIVYSQLKDQVAISLEEAICQGMDGFTEEQISKISSTTRIILILETKFYSLTVLMNIRKLRLVGSLKLSDHGWRVVWFVSRLDYLNLGTGKEGF